MRRAARKDANHAAITEGLEAYGVIVFDCSQVGDGFPDILCYGWNRSDNCFHWLPMEIKSSNAIRKKKTDGSDELTPSQKRLRDKRFRAPFPIVHSLAEALALFGIKENR